MAKGRSWKRKASRKPHHKGFSSKPGGPHRGTLHRRK